MDSSECPKAMIKAMAGMAGKIVPLNQPSDSLVNCRLRGTGAGGKVTWPRSRMVSGHQINNATTMTEVICIMRKALPLDSCIPLVFCHQKYTVTRTAKNAEK